MADSGAARKSFPWAPVLMVAGAAAFVGYHLVYVLTPFALSATLAYIVNPVITYFEIRGIRRDVVVVGFYASVLGLLSVAGGALAPAIGREMNLLQTNAPVYMTRFQASMDEAVSYVAWAAHRLRGPGEIQPERTTRSSSGSVFRTPGHRPARAFPAVFGPLHHLLSSHGRRGSISAVIQPFRALQEQSLYLLSEIENSWETPPGCYRGAGHRHRLLDRPGVAGRQLRPGHAILAGVSSLSPTWGHRRGGGGRDGGGFQFGTVKAGPWVVALFSGIRMADEALLVPIISKHSVHMHPLAYLLSMMIGGETFGFVGLVFAVPAACILKSLIKVWWDWYSSEGYFDTEAPFESTHIPYT